jgi:hypothetical protein
MLIVYYYHAKCILGTDRNTGLYNLDRKTKVVKFALTPSHAGDAGNSGSGRYGCNS